MATEHETEWQLKKTLADSMRHMLDNEILTDVSFEVGPPDGETVHIRAHKFMLVARSPVFEAMFSSGMSECIGPEARVRIEDIDADIFKELLNHMYCERASMSPESSMYLMYAAKKYMLPKLVTECVTCLSECLNVSNVIHFLEQSFQFDHKELQTACLKLISINAKAVLTGVEILSASREVLEAILELRRMSASESVVYKAAVSWCKHQLRGAVPKECLTDLRIRETLGDLLYKIHFPAMKPSEFAEISSESDVLTAEEKDSIYYFYVTRNDSQLKFPSERRIGDEDFVDRTVTCVRGRWRTTPEVDAINFTTDKDILLTGIGLYTGHTEMGYNVDVEILQSVKSLFKRSVIVPYAGVVALEKVVLDEPILILSGIVYSVKALSHHYIGHYGKVCQAVCAKGTVTFTFSKHTGSETTTEIYGQIPRLYFCYLESESVLL